MNLKVSIIIPTFNRAGYLSQAIESALAQDYASLEVIVSDNASTDETSEMVKRYLPDKRFKYFRNEKNLGMVPNWRKAVYEYSAGDFFLLLSDDDYLIDGSYISKAVGLIRANPEIVLVYANGFIRYEHGGKMVPLRLPFQKIEDGENIFFSKGSVKPQDFTLCNVLFNRKLAMELNAFGNDYNICCDSELFLKLCLYGKAGIVHDFVSAYRIHAANLLHITSLDLKILVNNLDFLLEPYRLAESKGIFSPKKLKKFEKRLLLPAIRGLLMTTITWYQDEYENVVATLANKNKKSLNKARGHPLFKIKLFIAKNMKLLYYCISGSYRRKVALNNLSKKGV